MPAPDTQQLNLPQQLRNFVDQSPTYLSQYAKYDDAQVKALTAHPTLALQQCLIVDDLIVSVWLVNVPLLQLNPIELNPQYEFLDGQSIGYFADHYELMHLTSDGAELTVQMPLAIDRDLNLFLQIPYINVPTRFQFLALPNRHIACLIMALYLLVTALTNWVMSTSFA